MCTLLILYRPKENWPLIIAGNRDETLDRPWIPPGKHWPDYPNIIAGKDLTAGGSWLGLNKAGIVTTILNRKNSLGPSDDKCSRGELVINVLKNDKIEEALLYLKTIDNSKWKPFNLFLANNKKAYWIKSTGIEKIEINPILEGRHFLDSHDINSEISDRYIYNKNKFELLKNPKPETSEWNEWINFLSQTNFPNNKPMAAMNIKNKYIENYGTMSSAIIAIPSDKINKSNSKSIFLFNNYSPDKNKFYAINTC